MFFKDNFKTDPVLQTLFLPKSTAIKSVWPAFENYVTEWLLYYFYCGALLYIICLCLSLCLVWRISVFISLS